VDTESRAIQSETYVRGIKQVTVPQAGRSQANSRASGPTTPDLPADDARSLAEARCQAAGLKTEWTYHAARPGDDEDDDRYTLRFAVPNGRYLRWHPVTDARADCILQVGVQSVTALAEYEAFFYPDLCEIEAQIRPIHLAAPLVWRQLSNLPGVVRISPRKTDDEDSDELEDHPKETWVLPFAAEPSQDWSASIGPCSDRFPVYAERSFGPRSGRLTLRLRSGSLVTGRHDDLLSILDRVSAAILFELDLRYSLALNLARLSPVARSRRTGLDGVRALAPTQRAREISSEAPRLPRNMYPSRPLKLYWYARSATNMPLLQFLASYQILEYYFATYYQREALDRMRQELLDPRNSPQDDAYLMRLLNLANAQGKTFGSEIDQLRATVRACVSNAHLKEYLEDPVRGKFYSGKQILKDVPRLDINDTKSDLRDQVTNRIYDIRCRIVHTKSDTNDSYAELMLPFSEEAESLTFDIDLIQYLAQRILIHRAEPLRI
jgi:hypothetical protein